MTATIAKTKADDLLEQGQEQGINYTNALYCFLYDNGRGDEVQKAIKDPGLFRKLMAQFESGDLEAK